MKKISELTQEEINTLSEEEFKAISPFEKKSCYDCKFMIGALSWYCANTDAIRARGTSLPFIIKCKYWQPDWSVIDSKYWTKENGYVENIEEFPIYNENSGKSWCESFLDFFRKKLKTNKK